MEGLYVPLVSVFMSNTLSRPVQTKLKLIVKTTGTIGLYDLIMLAMFLKKCTQRLNNCKYLILLGRPILFLEMYLPVKKLSSIPDQTQLNKLRRSSGALNNYRKMYWIRTVFNPAPGDPRSCKVFTTRFKLHTRTPTDQFTKNLL